MAPHRNRFLFAEYILAQWADHPTSAQAAEDRDTALSAVADVAELWSRFVPRPGDVAHTVTHCVRPVLTVLGHTLHPTADQPVSHSQAARTCGFLLTSAEQTDPTACLIVASWGRHLDQPPETRSDPTRCGLDVAPAVHIYNLLRDTKLEWGILTNGEEWRLYHADSAQHLDVYYAVDLPALLPDADAEDKAATATSSSDAAQWFYRFFRSAAFEPSADSLNELLHSSRRYRDKLGERLGDRAIDALRLLAQGFLDFPRNALQPDAATLDQLYDHSLVVLYWLLFVLYAESRGLLPVGQSRAYEDTYSLHALAQQVASEVRDQRPAVPSMGRYWAHICRLWDALYSGNHELGLPPHAAPLFDRRRYPFLREHTIGDSHLRQAIYNLSLLSDDRGADSLLLAYRDLNVRHMGAIYEQLLGYGVAVDATDGHRLRLVADGRSRKQTASYYTPDHVVDWLVHRTLGAVLDAAEERHTDLLPDGSRRLRTSRAALAEDVLNVKVLDPAVGSGHLLVAAADYIARRLTALGLIDPAELGGQAEITYWRRHVARSCVYGVDVNPLAVELARLSLWALATEPGQPLTFLDHHLRCGNSLIGARMADMHLAAGDDQPTDAPRTAGTEANRQLSMLDHPAFATSMRHAADLASRVSATADATLSGPERATRLYRDRFQRATERYRRLADIWTARDFGLPVGAAVWTQILSRTLNGDGGQADYAAISAQAAELARAFLFFHWELEFPDVFFPETPRSVGFDVVIGNPPYLFGEQIAERQKPFLERHYRLAAGQYDLYWLFYERTLGLLRPGGRHGFIVPDAILARDEVAALRRLLLHEHRLDAVAPGGRVFDEPGVGNVLLACHKAEADEQRDDDESVDADTFDLWAYSGEHWIRTRSLPLAAAQNAPGYKLWIGLDHATLDLVARLRRESQRLDDFARISRGEELGRRHLQPLAAGPPDVVPTVTGADIERLHPLQPTYGLPEALIKKHPSMYRPPKLVVVKTGSALRCTLDRTGYVTLQSTYNVSPYPTCRLDPAYLAALLSSSLLSWYLEVTVTGYKRVFPQLNQSNMASLPIRPATFTTPAHKRAALMAIGRRLAAGYIGRRGGASAALQSFVARQLLHEPPRADVVHDLLAWLAEMALQLNSQRRTLRSQAEPFDYLDRTIACVPFGTRFPDAAPAPSATDDLTTVHHDVDAVKLVPTETDATWRLDVRLKLRVAASGWREWEHLEDSRQIARRWTPAAMLILDPSEAAYYALALEHLSGFANMGSFPSGHTTTTWEKLLATKVPQYDAAADAHGLWQQRHRIRQVGATVERVQMLIDVLTCQMYGIRPEEAPSFVAGPSVL